MRVRERKVYTLMRNKNKLLREIDILSNSIKKKVYKEMNEKAECEEQSGFLIISCVLKLRESSPLALV